MQKICLCGSQPRWTPLERFFVTTAPYVLYELIRYTNSSKGERGVRTHTLIWYYGSFVSDSLQLLGNFHNVFWIIIYPREFVYSLATRQLSYNKTFISNTNPRKKIHLDHKLFLYSTPVTLKFHLAFISSFKTTPHVIWQFKNNLLISNKTFY